MGEAGRVGQGAPGVNTARLAAVHSLEDFEPWARRVLPAPVFGYIHASADGQRAAAANRHAFEDLDFVPQLLRDVSSRSTAVEVLGQRFSAPVGIAPMGLSALSAYRGDLVLAEAAGAAGMPMIMSGSSLIPMEEVARTNPGAWFQAYVTGDERRNAALVDRVARAGFGTLVITVDVQSQPNLEFARRSGFSAPLQPNAALAWQGLTHPRWLLGTFCRTLLRHGMPHFENNDAHRGAPILSSSATRDFSDRGAFTPRHFAAIRRQWPGRLVVKGICAAADARTVVGEGADAVIVSNHGGRQLDGTRASIRALPAVVQACPGVPVMLDSGVRRGTDALKALALGARLVFVGRPFAYAAAVAGAAGVRHGLRLIANEVSQGMAMLGLRDLGDIPAGCVGRVAGGTHFVE
ncbi:alpha-hydroxy-acid oxidizing protein [Xylophilus sp. Kf1]|nr:alpha-hydroxy-acid oxidizing protein [Xylophilus sp. Kf1]